MAELPTGTVTFLFTDIEGSTRLLRELGDSYAEALAEHRRLLRDAFAANDGVEVDTQGDAFFVAFSRAKDAAGAAADAQRSLEDGPVRVRIGLHTGEPIVTEDGYVGMDVHRGARIAAAGHGGQVLLSQTTRELLDESVELRDLGEHRLKDLTAPQRIFQLGDAEFSPLKSLTRTNLPIAATPLVGRERELVQIRDLIRDGARLVTVTGAGGSGKTRLALQVAAELLDDFADGVVFVPLASVQEPELVGPTITQVAGIRQLSELGESNTLLLLDNLEHLLAAAGELGSLLAMAPGIKLLVTSRAPLRIDGEREYPLDPLPEGDAVEFFLERARAVKPDFVPDESIVEICRRVDGLPLALELAASRVKVLDPPLLLERLGRRLPILTGGARDAPERQQTLRATIEWSYGLLDPASQAIFQRLAAFAESFSLEAAEHVAEAPLDDIAALVDWSLIKPIGEGRFLMLETIREFAWELLLESGDLDRVRDRHLSFFLALAEEAEPQLTGPEQREWYERLALERGNIREALGHACDTGDGERALLLSGAIWRFWWNRGPVGEAEHWYGRAFALAGDVSPRARAWGVFGAAHVAELRGDSEQARSQFEAAAELLRGVGETRLLILALAHLIGAHRLLGDKESAEAVASEALELARTSGDVRGASVIKSNLGYFLSFDGEYERASELIEESLDDSRAIGDVYGVAVGLGQLGTISIRRGELEAAADYLRESLELSSSLGDAHTIAHTFPDIAAVSLARGDAAASARLLAANEALCKTNGFELDPAERELAAETEDAVRKALGRDADRAWGAGAELDLSAAVELALRALD